MIQDWLFRSREPDSQRFINWLTDNFNIDEGYGWSKGNFLAIFANFFQFGLVDGFAANQDVAIGQHAYIAIVFKLKCRLCSTHWASWARGKPLGHALYVKVMAALASEESVCFPTHAAYCIAYMLIFTLLPLGYLLVVMLLLLFRRIFLLYNGRIEDRWLNGCLSFYFFHIIIWWRIRLRQNDPRIIQLFYLLISFKIDNCF